MLPPFVRHPVLALMAFLCAQDQPTFRARSDLVVLHVSVRDPKGAYVSGLPLEAFAVLDEGRLQTITAFTTADAPVSLGLAIDASGSMATKREMVIASAIAFTGISNPLDDLFVLAFNEDVRQAWAPRMIGESNLVSLEATLRGAVGGRGRTALYDAIAGGLARLSSARHGRQVLVVISDGADNASNTTLPSLIDAIERSNIVIYTVALKDPVDRDDNPRLLKRLAAASGGQSFEPDRLKDVGPALEAIARDIRTVYTLGFVPDVPAAGAVFRRLRVIVQSPDGRSLRVRTRAGYRAGSAGEQP
jgi:VWFA-related protein